MNNQHSYLEYISELLFFDGFDNLNRSFLGNDELKALGYTYIEQYAYYLRVDMVDDNDVEPIFTHDIMDINGFFDDFLLKNRRLLYKSLNQLEIKDEGSGFEEHLNRTYDELYKYHRKATKLEKAFFEKIVKEIEIIVSDLKIQYHIIDKHNAFKILNTVNGLQGYFQPKDLKGKFFEELYTLTYSFDLIDDVLVSDEMFTDVFTSPTLSEESKIYFIKGNGLVTSYLRELEQFFLNLNSKSIGDSKCFITKQGTPFTTSNYLASLSRRTKKDTEVFIKIKKSLDNLKVKYLTD